MNKNNIKHHFILKLSICFSLFSSLGFNCFSQTSELESDSSLYLFNNLIKIADVYSTSNYKQDSAIYIYHKVLNTFKNSIDNVNIYTYSNACLGLSNLHKGIGNYDSALYYLNEIVEIDNAKPYKNIKQIAMDYSSLANFYLTTGHPSISIPLLNEVSNILVEDFGKNNEPFFNSQYLLVQAQLAIAYTQLFRSQLAEITFTNALKLCEDKLGRLNKDFALLLLAYSSWYSQNYNYNKAISLIEEATKIIKNTEGEETDLYCDMLSSSIRLFIMVQDYSKANILAQEVLMIIKKMHGKNDIHYFIALNNYANTEKLIGNYEKAISLFSEVRQGAKIKYSKTKFYSEFLKDFGELYMYQGDENLSKCEDLLLESHNLNLELFGVESEDYHFGLIKLAEFYAISRKLNKADFYFLQANDWILNNFKNTFWGISFQDQINLLTHVDRFNQYINKYIWAQINLSPIRHDLIKSVYNNELITKGSSLISTIKIKDIIQNEEKSKSIEYLNSVHSSNLDILKNINLETLTDSVYKKKIELEELLTEKYKSELIKSLNVSDWIGINKKLKNNEGAIDFFYFNTSNNYTDTDTDKFIYGAKILSPKLSEPVILYLFITNKEIDNMLRNKPLKQNNYLALDNPYNPDTHIINNLIWNKIDSLLTVLEITTVYITPAGMLHNINLAALPTDNGSIFGNYYNTHILGSSSYVINYKPLYLNSEKIKEIVTFGDIDYNKSNSTPTPSLIENNIGYPQIAEIATRSGTSKFGYLPGTKKEIEDIANLCDKNKIPVVSYEGSNASEDNFKKLNGQHEPYVLHIATHGYFFPDPIKTNPTASELLQNKKYKYKLSDDPLLRSGLILSGANATWGKTDYFTTTTEDGILTGYEIANTDLSGCQLVVLSACETGLGDINASEGVFGLQRAFKMAGVKNIIMSLWTVPDNETPKLMNLFYNNCFKGESVHDALQHAQNEMKANGYPPYYWAGFKLLE